MTMIKIHDVTANDVIEREMTKDELADFKAQIEAGKVSERKHLDKHLAKQALLDRLGISAAEAKLLLS